MSDQVSVRLAVIGGNEFRNNLRAAGAEGARAMQPLQAAARGVSPALQAVTLQASQLFGTFAGGSGPLGAVAAGLGNAAIAGGAFGIAGAVALTVFGSLIPLLTQGGQSAAQMAAEMTNLEGSTGAVQGAVSGLEGVQNAYNAAIKQQAGASSAAAAAVLANSQAEFSARKQVLGVEIELLRIRSAEQATDLNNLTTTFRMEGEAAITRGRNTSAYSGDEAAEAAYNQAGVQRPAGQVEREGSDFLVRNEKTILAMRKLRAEAELTNLTLKDSEKALGTAFDALGTDDGKGGSGGAAKAAGGAKAVGKAVGEASKIFDMTRTSAEKYAAEVAKLNGLLAQGAIDQDTYNRRIKQLDSEMQSAGAFASNAAMTVKSAMTSLFDGIFEGGTKAGEVIEGLGKKLAAMALQESVFRLLSSLMPKTFGADGFIPLLANANGNAFAGGKVTAFASGGIVNSPTTFAMRGGMGLMGEAGPEAIMPLARVNGQLGVRTGGGGGGMVVNIIDQRSGGADIRQERTRGPDGRETLRIVVAEETSRGSFDKANRARYGSAPQQVKR